MDSINFLIPLAGIIGGLSVVLIIVGVEIGWRLYNRQDAPPFSISLPGMLKAIRVPVPAHGNGDLSALQMQMDAQRSPGGDSQSRGVDGQSARAEDSLEEMFIAFRLLMDHIGLVQDKPGQVSGNGLLYSAETMIAVIQNMSGRPYTEAEAKERDNFFAMLASGVRSCEHSFQGLWRRHPDAFSNDQESLDDYIGICTMSSFMSGAWARKAFYLGQGGWDLGEAKVRWYYPNELQYQTKFGVRAWLGRFPAVIHHMARCAQVDSLEKFPNSIIKQAWWAVSVALSGALGKNDSEKRDSWILSWVMSHAAREYSAIERIGVSVYRWRLKRAGGIRKIFRDYFQWDHPLSIYAKD